MTKQEFLAMSFQKGLKLYVYGQTRFEDYITTIKEISSNSEIYFGGGWNNIENNSEYFKPICRPLSDLTKEIEHKGERFVPTEWLEDSYPTLDLHKQALLLVNDTPDWINQCDFMLVMQLIKWHFNLMDENEPFVDVNTLPENPYK